MISVAIVGQGNVAFHLLSAFKKTKNITVTHINSRKKIILTGIDVAIIAVSDDVIGKVSSKINNENTLVVHTSGSVSMSSLQNNGKKGVFYPLQSFSKDKDINLNDVPFCLEAENEKGLQLLNTLASTIGEKIYYINSKQRQQLHVAAVFVNNFTNHLYKIGHDICQTYDVPFEILHPLVQETASKIVYLSPKDAQTGPAKRNDTKTIKNHLDLLNKQQKNIYKVLTESIRNGEKL